MSETTDLSEASPLPAHTFFELYNEIGIINQLASTEFERVLPHGLTQAQFTVLNHCMRLGDNKTPARLAAAFQITRGTLTSTLKRLVSKGFVDVVADADDGRSKRVLLTDAGRSAHSDALAAAAQHLTHMTQPLTDDQVRAILPVLRELRIWLDNNRS